MTTLGALPQVWVLVAQGREQFDVLRNLYRLIHKRAQQAVIWAIRESRDFAEWREAMAYQIVARSSQHFVPVTMGGQGVRSGGDPTRSLFDKDELEGLRKGEAYTSEQFAHLSVAIIKGWHEEYRIGFLREITREAIEEWDRDPFPIRRELRAMRSRYGVPPFLALELDDYLKNQGQRPGE